MTPRVLAALFALVAVAQVPAPVSIGAPPTGVSPATAAVLLDPRDPPLGVNVALSALEGHIVSVTSTGAAKTFAASNLRRQADRRQVLRRLERESLNPSDSGVAGRTV